MDGYKITVSGNIDFHLPLTLAALKNNNANRFRTATSTSVQHACMNVWWCWRVSEECISVIIPVPVVCECDQPIIWDPFPTFFLSPSDALFQPTSWRRSSYNFMSPTVSYNICSSNIVVYEQAEVTVNSRAEQRWKASVLCLVRAACFWDHR